MGQGLTKIYRGYEIKVFSGSQNPWIKCDSWSYLIFEPRKDPGSTPNIYGDIGLSSLDVAITKACQHVDLLIDSTQ